MHTKVSTRFAAIALAGFAAAYSAASPGAGLAIIEHSAQGMGNAFAGGGAAAGDASTIFFNPASMTLIEGTQMLAAGHLIKPSFEFTSSGSFQAIPGGVLPLLPGAATTNDGGRIALVPNFYYKRDLTHQLKFGLAVNSPFGLATRYNKGWIGRFQSVESEVRTVNVNPALAYKFGNASIGAGLSVQYIDATLSNAVDFDAVCGGGVSPGTCTGFPGSGTNEGFVENTGDDISLGWNVGLMYEFTPRSRASVAYRSKIKHEPDGKADFSLPAGVINTAFGGAVDAGIRSAFADDGISAAVELPASLSLSAFHQINDRFAVMADATWTEWDSVQKLVIKFDKATTAGGPGIEALDFENSWRLSLGANYYHPNNKLTLRTGVAFDESPVPNATSRSARLPDNDRIWLSLGASYEFTKVLSVDVGYTHLFINDTNISRTGSTGSVLKGTYESDADILSMQARYRFK